MLINPAIDETAKIILTKVDTLRQLNCVILDGNRNDRPADTFYTRTIFLSDEQFNKFDTAVIQKTRIKQPHNMKDVAMELTFNS